MRSEQLRAATLDHHGEPRLRKVGEGRSGKVYLDCDGPNPSLVRKVFQGDTASNAILQFLTGAPNPYWWCEPAIRTAVARRRVLSLLVRFWFRDKVRLPRTEGYGWNQSHRAYELKCEYIRGHHVPLRGPEDSPDLLDELVGIVMKSLQKHLAEAGFDGLLWQAGRGNPIACSNFMLERSAAGVSRWVWVDLESGVPPLFGYNPFATLALYLPKSLHHRRLLFDDVDIHKLRQYIQTRQQSVRRVIGTQALTELLARVGELERSQYAWKILARHQRSVAFEHSQGNLATEERDYYQARPFRWYARILPRWCKRTVLWMVGRLHEGWAWLRSLNVASGIHQTWRFLSSQDYRSRFARLTVAWRIRSWSRRRFLDRATARCLLRQLRADSASVCITDFGMHLAIKPVVKASQWVLLPALLAIGALSVTTTGLLMIAGGPIGRSLYTSVRLMQATIRQERRPWVAFLVGLLPVLGNAAYPVQLLTCSREDTGELARFTVYETCATLGRAVPIWGGRDSLLEHYSNRLGFFLVQSLRGHVALRQKSLTSAE